MQICLEVELTGDDAHDVGFPLFYFPSLSYRPKQP